MSDSQYAVSAIMQEEFPAEYRRRVKEDADRQAALELWKVLTNEPPARRGYVTVKVYSDEIEQGDMYGRRSTEYRVWFETAKVRERRIEIAVPAYRDMPWRVLSSSAVDEIKRRVKTKIKRLFHRKA